MDGSANVAATSAPSPGRDSPLALICGGGVIPAVVAAAVADSGRRVVLFALRGWADPDFVATYPHHWIAIGQVGRLLRLARAEGCRDIVLIGTLLRPALRDVRLDWTTIRMLPRIGRMFRGGDDRLLSGVGRILEAEGFKLLGAHEVAPSILMPAGALTRHVPTAADQSDIARALAVLDALGPLDVGQAIVVADGYVAAIEAAEGTDAMLARICDLRREGRLRTPLGRGVLVKAPKRGQDARYDLPAIGSRTIEEVAQAGLAGLAVTSGAAIVADPGEMVSLADRRGVFVFGLPGPVP